MTKRVFLFDEAGSSDPSLSRKGFNGERFDLDFERFAAYL